HLASSAVLQNLKRLDLRYAGLTDAGVLALSRAKEFGALRELDLEGNDISAVGVLTMREASWVRKLSGLGLSRNPLGDAGVLALARLPVYLKRLELSRVDMGDEGLDALLQAPAVRLVEELDLSGNDWTHQGASQFGGAPPLERLMLLDLTQDKLGTPENLARMAWTPMAAHIQHIRITLSHLDFGDAQGSMRSGDLESMDTQLLVQFADLPQLGERMVTSPYLSASLRRLLARVLTRSKKGLDDARTSEQIPAAIYYLARGYIKTMAKLNDARRVLP
ncbi:MAG: hypothetical protein AAGI01_06250, partial [Myxococcota bacterium]